MVWIEGKSDIAVKKSTKERLEKAIEDSIYNSRFKCWDEFINWVAEELEEDNK